MPDVRPTVGDSSWFVNDRFGLFIHWGIFAPPARHEWVKHREEIPDEAYRKYLDHFDPDLYDPEAWAAVATRAGMKYFVITTKHHDGFCLWDSQLTEYKATNTPAGRDLIGPMVEAFRERGLKVGLYHSLLDWHHPDFAIDDLHPLRNRPDREKLNAGRDQRRYAAYLRGQVRELLTGYGKIDLLFYDFSYPATQSGRPEGFVGKGRDDWESEKLLALTRELQPGILVNDRLDLIEAKGGWDYGTPQQFLPRRWVEVEGQRVVWETCQTFSGSWGYHREESSWKTVEQLVRMLIAVVSRGGNLLLNVGPTGRGEFDRRALDRLAGIGEWMRRHGRSIYGCTGAPDEIPTPEDCRLTFDPERKRLYVHLFAWPCRELFLDGLAGRVEYAQLLNDASEVGIVEPAAHQQEFGGELGGELGGESGDAIALQLPVVKPDAVVPVVELFLK